MEKIPQLLVERISSIQYVLGQQIYLYKNKCYLARKFVEISQICTKERPLCPERISLREQKIWWLK